MNDQESATQRYSEETQRNAETLSVPPRAVSEHLCVTQRNQQGDTYG